ncbi:MAG: RadC family protein [Allosphingosinicella sp.]
MAPSAKAGTLRGRQILVELLRPFGGEAEDWSDRLIRQYGSLGAVLAAAPAAPDRLLADAPGARDHLATIREAMLHALRSEATAGPVLTDSSALLDYLTLDMGHLATEQLRVLFLNKRNELLDDRVLAEGSVDMTPVYPRDIIRRALETGATALILVHNHPSGDPTPSRGDVEATRRVAAAAQALDICVHDHVIIAREGWSSFRALGLLRG